MIDLQTISIMLASASVTIAALYYAFTLRYTRMNMKTSLETRQAQLFMRIYERFYDPEFSRQQNWVMFVWEWTDFDDAWKKYGPETNMEAASAFISVARYYEGIGVLVKRKLIDVNLVEELMSEYVIRSWDKMGPFFKEARERFKWPHLFQEFENISNTLEKTRQPSSTSG
ncbi:hypothetical protein AC482_06320 [miscellaneous Crenarchaeota group-15 archaeon DG-45]|uniref:DUF4760 domain-containing protein n=1 Tax=miscellaneous Crenarchaeota group-15 archaeon DG-45 TaxID=1685127 RepID=A0A0M0BM70_9ARCH|nr:MAG: hypothetical protein AC482_06320 [miscellaneous Crenarchaeota group-15 archaeon DG-45]